MLSKSPVVIEALSRLQIELSELETIEGSLLEAHRSGVGFESARDDLEGLKGKIRSAFRVFVRTQHPDLFQDEEEKKIKTVELRQMIEFSKWALSWRAKPPRARPMASTFRRSTGAGLMEIRIGHFMVAFDVDADGFVRRQRVTPAVHETLYQRPSSTAPTGSATATGGWRR